MKLFRDLAIDIRKKRQWRYRSTTRRSLIKAVLADGTTAMLLYRLMQWSRRWRLSPLEMLFGRLNSICCQCTIGRGAEFGPGFVLLHSNGVVINGAVRGGENILLEHQVTIGAEEHEIPKLGNDIYIGAGAKVLGAVVIGDGAGSAPMRWLWTTCRHILQSSAFRARRPPAGISASGRRERGTLPS